MSVAAAQYEKRRFAVVLYQALYNNQELFTDAFLITPVVSRATLLAQFDYTTDNPGQEKITHRRRSKIGATAALADGMALLSDADISGATHLDDLLDLLEAINPDIAPETPTGTYLDD